jgi:tRNA pseudouridine55 synthase
VDGILNIDKPRGKTSFQVVAHVRRLSGERRVGHAGTLDPEATGVLAVCLGKATRLVEYLAETRKTYRAEIELGISTNTYDAAGVVTSTSDVSSLSPADVVAAVHSFTGVVRQTPPMFSAVKVNGTPLYRWARAGLEMPREPRTVEFSRIDILDCTIPLVTLEVECSKGTYIRSLAHDIGESLGVGASLRNLIRLRSGPLGIDDAISLSELDCAFMESRVADVLLPMDIAVSHLPQVVVDERDECAIANGRAPTLEACQCPGEGLCRAYSEDRRLIAILYYDEDKGYWRPRKVLARGPIGT